MVGNGVRLQIDSLVNNRRRPGRECWGCAGGAGVDKDFVAFERFTVHAEGVRAGEARMSAIEMHLRAGGDLLFLALAEAEHHFIFLRDDFGKVHGDVRASPRPSERRCARNERPDARCTMVFVGVQPVLMQVPPRKLSSMSATIQPMSASAFESGAPDWPEPMMMASYFIARSSRGEGARA